VRDIEDLIGEAGQCALGQGNQPHRHVDADDRDGCVDPVLNDPQVPLDVTASQLSRTVSSSLCQSLLPTGPPEGDVMTALAPDSGARPPGEGPRHGVIKVRHAVITSLAVITPAAAI
jgi:hypothetical protein